MGNALRINPTDNVAVALETINCGDVALGVTAADRIPFGHKIALENIEKNQTVVKYGYPIGTATENILPGQWVHSHNMTTNLKGQLSYTYEPNVKELAPLEPRFFNGFRRKDGRVSIRNELWIIPLVGCVNDVCKTLETMAAPLAEEFALDGVHHFPHPYGCSQLGSDLSNTRRILAQLCRHPNAGGVLVVSLGCENNTLESFCKELGTDYDDKIRYMVCQDVKDELAEGLSLLRELAEYASEFHREPCSAAELVIGLKCGGSDGLSGITGNPVVGRLSDMIVAMGGTSILTEVPEMFGAETVLMDRCENRKLFEKTAAMVNGFKEYFISNGQPVGENPSPGNKAGGITTLEDKSLGCIQKGGKAPISDVLDYGERVVCKGLNLLCAPGNDLVSSTALTAAGAQLILFTTGRGTPFSAPSPTIKISTNSALYEEKPHWIDIDTGSVAVGEGIDSAAERLLSYILEVANGRHTCSEMNSQHGIAIWKGGVTL